MSEQVKITSVDVIMDVSQIEAIARRVTLEELKKLLDLLEDRR